ncbi:ABC transporter substrate-binding protein [Nocardioides campestrisoli]|uniref:ABC transporter substrate-binding protein n=1 Tax=Nocardioides campestrisoli TaxID=2736757 RepID=UPI00163D4570|nr:ABC transporter substrate-binding protein [Nocardioides campestrisoli]
MIHVLSPRRRAAASGAALLLAGAALSACSSDAAAGEDGYLVGFPALLSGPAAFAGEPLAQGAKLAAAEINETGFLGDGVEVDLKVDDLKNDPAVAISLYRQYVADGASGVLCCGAAETGALAPLIADSEVPGIVTSANRAEAVQVPKVFSTVLLPAAEGGMYDTFVDDMVAAEGYETAVLAVNGDSDAMTIDGDVWEAALERNGVEVLERVNIAMADTNYTGPATKIAGTKADVVVSSMLGGSTAQLARALRDRGYDQRILTSYGASGDALFETAGAAMAGVAFTTPFAAGYPGNELAEEFVAAYEKEYDEAPDLFAAQGYTAMWMMAQGLKDAGDPDPAKVSAALAKVSGMESVYGDLTFVDGQATFDQAGTYLEWTAQGELAQLDLG